MKIQLSDHFTYKRLLRFVLPSIIMMICTSMYSIIDGLFVSNFVGKTAFAAINLSMPLLMVIAALGFMIGTGGSAIISKTLGEKKTEKAKEYFSFLIYMAAGFGILMALLTFLFAKPILTAMGAKGEMLQLCVLYVRISMISLPAYFLQNIFQNFLVVAEKPSMSLAISVCAGLTNVVLDYLFIAVFKWGIAGAALATSMGELVGGIAPIIYFLSGKNKILQFKKTKFYGKILLKTCTNGASELMSSISSSVVAMLYNLQLMRFAGEDGVAAYGVIMYVNFVFAAIFLGYSMGSAPITSYHYGAANHSELQNIFKKSLSLIVCTGIVLTALSEGLAHPIIKIFVGYDEELFQLTYHGFRIYALFFLICGFNIWGSSFFTALNNGVISAIISFLRTLVFQCGAVLILPAIFELDGIWFAVLVAETAALLITTTFLIKQRTKYHYL